MKPGSPLILVHGGAGTRAMTAAQRAGLREALVAGYGLLHQGRPAVEAVEATIRVLEASGLFNAGVGARLQLDGVRRMDAALMEGHGLRAGAVAAIQQVRHPITAARLVMDETTHVLLVGEPATRFARHFRLERQRSPTRAQRKASRAAAEIRQARGSFQRTLRLYDAMRSRRAGKLGTVGAVALDREGSVAAGASTGGIALMLPGRVGDTPLIGSGIYADDEAGAVSMTGWGESIMRMAVAKEICNRLAAGATPSTATRLVLEKLTRRTDGAAGALVLTPHGRFAIRHTTPRMAAGYWGGRGEPTIADRFE